MRRREFVQAGAAIGWGVLSLDARRRPAPRAVPTPQHLAWQDAAMGLFLHFGINTFTDREWGDGTEDPALFNPTALDARQWVRAAKAGGFRYVVLTAKHHDGFCLWPSRLTKHSVQSSPWRGGAGDVVREAAEAARAEGLGLGLYLSPWDRHEPSYGTGEAYNDFYCGQLEELLTGYGPLVEVWFDGANGEGPNGKRQTYDWARIHALVRRRQPRALIFSDAGPDIRWIGNERGVAGDPNWCAVDPARVPVPGLDGPEIIDALQHGDPDGTTWRPGEADVSIRPGWFWHPAEDDKVRTVDDLLSLYASSVGRNANLLLNVPPTKTGLLHETDVQRLAEFGARRAAWFAHDLAEGVRMHGTRDALELELAAPVTCDTVVLQEVIARGQAIARYAVEVWGGEAWREIAAGTTIGHKKIDCCSPVTGSRFRVRIVDALDDTRIDGLHLYRSA